MTYGAPVTRLVRPEDVAELTELLRKNRGFLTPWSPEWDEEFFTFEKQRKLVEETLGFHEAGMMVPLVICDARGNVAGRLNLNGIVRGALQSASVGYWVGKQFNGQGLASQAVGEAVSLARDALQLHRLQAETLLRNRASQRVLAKNSFVRFGMAPQYLKIDGRWQDHLMYQRILTDPDGT